MRNKLSVRYEMLQMTSRFDGLPDSLLRYLKENEFVKGKTHHLNNIQLSINVKLHYNKIIIRPVVCECLPHFWDVKWQNTQTHIQKKGEEKNSFHALNAIFYVEPFNNIKSVYGRDHYITEWTWCASGTFWMVNTTKPNAFLMWKSFVCVGVCVCVTLPIGKRSTT